MSRVPISCASCGRPLSRGVDCEHCAPPATPSRLLSMIHLATELCALRPGLSRLTPRERHLELKRAVQASAAALAGKPS